MLFYTKEKTCKDIYAAYRQKFENKAGAGCRLQEKHGKTRLQKKIKKTLFLFDIIYVLFYEVHNLSA